MKIMPDVKLEVNDNKIPLNDLMEEMLYNFNSLWSFKSYILIFDKNIKSLLF